jgi:hypothetical protein
MNLVSLSVRRSEGVSERESVMTIRNGQKRVVSKHFKCCQNVIIKALSIMAPENGRHTPFPSSVSRTRLNAHVLKLTSLDGLKL